MSDSESQMEISFSLGRGRTVYVVGEYDHKEVNDEDRIKFWGIINQFGQELGIELSRNYSAKLIKVVMCEVDPGHIMFELETDASASIRRKVIEAVQREFVDPKQTTQKPLPLYKVREPDGLQ